MNIFLKELFEYNHNCNQNLIIVFRENESKLSEKSINLFSHLLNAHEIWNKRIEGKISSVEVWGEINIQEMENTNRKNYNDTALVLDQKDIYQQIQYMNTKGQTFKSSIKDILFHIVNHSTYHRGQIAIELKHCGIDPINTDYIFYKRNL